MLSEMVSNTCCCYLVRGLVPSPPDGQLQSIIEQEGKNTRRKDVGRLGSDKGHRDKQNKISKEKAEQTRREEDSAFGYYQGTSDMPHKITKEKGEQTRREEDSAFGYYQGTWD